MMIDTKDVKDIVKAVQDKGNNRATSNCIKACIDIICGAILERLNDYEEKESEAIYEGTKSAGQ